MVRNWAFPDADVQMANELGPDGTYQLAHLRAALDRVIDWRAAVDCGAHVGTWTVPMAARFSRVIAVEPSPDTFECLVHNVATKVATGNVETRQVAVGAVAGHVSMAIDPHHEAKGNTGARYVTPGGAIPMEDIDAWQLPALGFLKLDIEGAEPFALEGAAETLVRCRPIVLFENKALWAKHYGIAPDEPQRILGRCGYRHLETIMRDEIWGPQ
jgi:FkbM family methyltransferase